MKISLAMSLYGNRFQDMLTNGQDGAKNMKIKLVMTSLKSHELMNSKLWSKLTPDVQLMKKCLQSVLCLL